MRELGLKSKWVCDVCNSRMKSVRETCTLDNLIHLTQALDKLFGLVQNLVDDNNLVKEFVFNSNKSESGKPRNNAKTNQVVSQSKDRRRLGPNFQLSSSENLDCDEKVVLVEEKDTYAEKVVRDYMKQNGVGDIRCEKLQTRNSDYSSFKVSVDENHLDTVLNADFWLKGAFVKEYIQPRQARAGSGTDGGHFVRSHTFLGTNQVGQSRPK
ncbi:hypothetical protein J6590_009202 [Homalodisca vitripennis]|nr:hypothetical protein J6590_009202 [Homalodisca vitripennis]